MALDHALCRFWDYEDVLRAWVLSAIDNECEHHSRDTHTRQPDGRYVVRIPFTQTRPLPLGSSRSRADKLLLNLQRCRLNKRFTFRIIRFRNFRARQLNSVLFSTRRLSHRHSSRLMICNSSARNCKRFFLHRFVYCADLAQMYRQILVHEEDRDL